MYVSPDYACASAQDALERLLQDLGGSDPDVEVLLAEAKMDLQCDENGYHFFDKRTGRWTKRSNEAAALLRHVMSFSPKGLPASPSNRPGLCLTLSHDRQDSHA